MAIAPTGVALLMIQQMKMHIFRISVSYNRVMEVKRFMARAVVNQFVSDGIVLATNTLRKVFEHLMWTI